MSNYEGTKLHPPRNIHPTHAAGEAKKLTGIEGKHVNATEGNGKAFRPKSLGYKEKQESYHK